MRPPNVAPLLVAALFLAAGCLGASGPQVQPTSEPTQAPATGTTELQRHFNGTILVRVPGERVEQGDRAAFCFAVPRDTTLLSGHLTWTPDQQMGLEFQYNARVFYYGGNSTVERVTKVTPPIDLTVQNPASGAGWFVYAGPGAVGGAVTWNLDLTWSVARAGASLDETYEAYQVPC